MHRRQYLATLGAGTSGLLAGCSLPGMGAGPTTDAGTEETAGTETGTGTETVTTSSPESFELTDLQATKTTRLNEAWGFGLSVRNVTSTARTFRSTLSAKPQGGEWR